MPYPDNVKFSTHAAKRIVERGFTRTEIEVVLDKGEIIEKYPDDQRGESYLMLGWIAEDPVHVVAADQDTRNLTIVVTVYDPSEKPSRWSDDYRRRL